MPNPVHYRETKYGFEYGAVNVFRVASDDRGYVVVGLKTKRKIVHIVVSPKGRTMTVRGPEEVMAEWDPE